MEVIYVNAVIPSIQTQYYSLMGGESHKPAPKPTLEDTLIEMKMATKKMARESAKAMKESEGYLKKAKEAMKKGNEEGAKLYLQSAASKHTESMSIQRMGLKMEFMAGHMKNMESNQQIMGVFQSMGAAVNNIDTMDFAKMNSNMQKFERKMDEMMINGKMMEEVMSTNGIDTTDTVQKMYSSLKEQLAVEEINQMNKAATIREQEEINQQKIRGL